MMDKLSWIKTGFEFRAHQAYPELIDYEGRQPGHLFIVSVPKLLPENGNEPIEFVATFVETRNGERHGRTYQTSVSNADPKHVKGWFERHKASEARDAAFQSKQFKERT